jgi:hypothetical protein
VAVRIPFSINQRHCHMNKPRSLFLSVLLLVLAISGCASTGDTNGEGVGHPNLISLEEIERSDARNAYELIEHLRPRWLQQRFNRSTGLGTTILVYQNNTRLGGLEMLREVPTQGVHSIRYMGSAEAGRLPGAGAGSQHVDGAIVVTTAAQRQ